MFEDAREQHKPQPSLTTSFGTAPPRSQSSTQQGRNTQSSTSGASLTSPQSNEDSASSIDRNTVPCDTSINDEGYNDSKVHFSIKVNAGWQKLEHYYNKSDLTPVHRVAALLHPRMKWRWFKHCWRSKPAWIADARASIAELWREYKDMPADAYGAISTPIAPQDEWSLFSDTEGMD